jgi:ABC-type phosphate transport system substrate-binding protein
MKNSFAILTLAVCSIILSSFTSSPPAGNGIAIIVNKENPVSNLSASEVKLYYLRTLKGRWPSINKGIRPVTRKAKCPERDAFHDQIIKMSDTEVETYFALRQYENAERSPDKMGSDAETIEFVKQEIGAIGFISTKSLTADIQREVKVVLEF